MSNAIVSRRRDPHASNGGRGLEDAPFDEIGTAVWGIARDPGVSVGKTDSARRAGGRGERRDQRSHRSRWVPIQLASPPVVCFFSEIAQISFVFARYVMVAGVEPCDEQL